MVSKVALSWLQLLLVAAICFAGAYYFSRPSAHQPPPVLPPLQVAGGHATTSFVSL